MNTTFILQKDVVDDLFIREDEFKNFIKFIKKNFCNYTLITDFTDETEFRTRAAENPILEILLDKFSKIKYVIDLKSQFENGKILELSSKRSIVLSNIDDTGCQNYLNNHGLLFFNLSNLNKWDFYNEVIFSKSIKVTRDVNYPINLKFTAFTDFTKYLKYCKTVIIFDKYLFGNKTNQRITKNLYKMIEEILLVNKKMEIMIISEFKEDEISIAYDSILDHLKIKGFNEFRLNLIHHSKAMYPRKFEGLHSRFILSNYIHIRSNDSFNFFKDNGEINNLVDIDIKFNLTTENSYSYRTDLDAVKTYVDKIKNEPNCGNKSLRITFYKDKMNYLMN